MNIKNKLFELKKNNIKNWLKKYNIKPKNLNIYVIALLHNSYAKIKNNFNFQKLEFFGDSILNFFITKFLLFKYKDKNEGQLTEIKKNFISEKILIKISKKIGLDNIIIFGKAEKKNLKKKKIYSDFFESFLAALFLDLGVIETNKFLVENIFIYIDKEEFSNKDYKTLLNEELAKNQLSFVEYEHQIKFIDRKNFHIIIAKWNNKEILKKKFQINSKNEYKKIELEQIISKILYNDLKKNNNYFNKNIY